MLFAGGKEEGIQRRIWKFFVQMLLGMRRLVRISSGKGGFDQLLSEELLDQIERSNHCSIKHGILPAISLSLCPSEDIPLPHTFPSAPLRRATTHKPLLWAAPCSARSHPLPQPGTAGEPGWSLRSLPALIITRFYDPILDLGVGFPYQALLPRLQNPIIPGLSLEI